MEEEGEPPPKIKYAVRPPRDLASKFEVRMEEKERGKIEEIKRRQREEEAAAQAVSAQQCWVWAVGAVIEDSGRL